MASPFGLSQVPWKTAGRKPAVQLLALPLGNPRSFGSLITINAGRSALAEPRPYVIHEPTLGFPMRVTPVFIMKRAGEWLLESVCIEWMNAIRSMCLDRCGKRLDAHPPLWPC